MYSEVYIIFEHRLCCLFMSYRNEKKCSGWLFLIYNESRLPVHACQSGSMNSTGKDRAGHQGHFTHPACWYDWSERFISVLSWKHIFRDLLPALIVTLLFITVGNSDPPRIFVAIFQTFLLQRECLVSLNTYSLKKPKQNKFVLTIVVSH